MLIYILDIPARLLTNLTLPQCFCFNRSEVIKFYINNWLLIDLIACLPLDFLLTPLNIDPVIIRYVMLIRLLKFKRI